MMRPLLAHLLLQAVLLYDTLAWEVKMPKDIHGLCGSCLVIPCSFSYTSYPPKNPRRVVWYQWVSKGYPLVYDPLHANDVVAKFRGKTDLYSYSSGDCSLLIKNLEKAHHGEKLYAWIDPENVGLRTYKFYDVTSTILVSDYPQQPSINISGGEQMGDIITVACSTFHTCPYSKPDIILNGIEGTDQLDNEHIKDGLWKITLTRTGVVKKERLTIECSVKHYGVSKVTATQIKSATCVHQRITIEPELADVTEGFAKTFTCSVYHSCQRETPTITWNYKNMQVSTGSKTLSGVDRVTYSIINFLGAKEDHGKKLICTAKFSGRNTETHVVVHVQQYQKPVQILNETFPDKPVMSSLPEDTEPGTRITVKCSVNHTCSSHPPKISWSVPTVQETISHNHMGGGVCETMSAVTFIPTGNEEKEEIVCSAKFWGDKTQNSTASLIVKRVQGVGFEPYVIASSLIFILICILTGVFIYKRRHRPNNACTVSGNKPFSKPHIPSPKSEPKSDSGYNYEADYANMEELNVYGNV
ncbi:sialoadhesin isoform X1 [Pseudorasbora parva]|uniref:sialoadhesin isoform X1 n=1 Tax=Pseudorasbora parva TaxID=51549 RepID=UPI00351F7579